MNGPRRILFGTLLSPLKSFQTFPEPNGIQGTVTMEQLFQFSHSCYYGHDVQIMPHRRYLASGCKWRPGQKGSSNGLQPPTEPLSSAETAWLSSK